MSKIVAIIPARSGSKGVPDKNIKRLGNYTLLEWTIKACQSSEFIDEIYVSTDSLKYSLHAKKAGALVPFLRPQNISKDNSTDYEFISHALHWFEINSNLPNYIVHMRPTTPLRDPKIIDKAIETFIKNQNFTSLRSVHKMSESAYKTFEIDSSGRLLNICNLSPNLDIANNARQSFSSTYSGNGYVDVLSVSYIKKTGLLHGDNVLAFETEQVIEVDSPQDFKYLEFELSNKSTMHK